MASPIGTLVSDDAPAPSSKLNVVCVGGHPDDPETGCGATLARYSSRGHNVTIIYLTRGEAGIPGKTHEEAVAVRAEEAIKACQILGAKPVFAGQIDGSSEISNTHYEAFERLPNGLKPDVVFTHWPVDSHRDHCAASLLTYQAWLRGGKKYALVYFEVMSGEQTSQFAPNFYVDVSETWEKKKQACFMQCKPRSVRILRLSRKDGAISRLAIPVQTGGSVCRSFSGSIAATGLVVGRVQLRIAHFSRHLFRSS